MQASQSHCLVNSPMADFLRTTDAVVSRNQSLRQTGHLHFSREVVPGYVPGSLQLLAVQGFNIASPSIPFLVSAFGELAFWCGCD